MGHLKELNRIRCIATRQHNRNHLYYPPIYLFRIVQAIRPDRHPLIQESIGPLYRKESK